MEVTQWLRRKGKAIIVKLRGTLSTGNTNRIKRRRRERRQRGRD